MASRLCHGGTKMSMDTYMRRLSDILSSLYEKNNALSKLFDISGFMPSDREQLEKTEILQIEKFKNFTIYDLCEQLLSSQGDVSGISLASQILNRYAKSDDEQQKEFFHYLNNQLDLNSTALENALAAYKKEPSKETYRKLLHHGEPRRQELARRLNQVPGATEMLVEMRKDLHKFSKQDRTLEKVDLDFRHLFTSWFNRGFLMLEPISWTSPANILEKIIEYEAVHAIDSWEDLRRRLKPNDRRCFAFFHPSMPEEPLIFVEVALTKGIPSSIQKVLAEERAPLSASQADTAVFYSISNCQSGLAGISFGNSLIKQVVADLSRELPNLKTFVTLSPIPGLTKWLEQTGNAGRANNPETLKTLAAYYLLKAKKINGTPLDPVAQFHLNNGAMVHQVHIEADISEKGIQQSKGMMVNYLYDLQRISSNHETFATNKEVVASDEVKALSHSMISQNNNEMEPVMTNPLYDSLFGKHSGKDTTFLHLINGEEISHDQFIKTIAQFSHVIKSNGLVPGDRLAAQIEKTPEALALYGACLQSGVIFLPLNTAYTPAELSYFVDNSGAKLLVFDAKNSNTHEDIADKFNATSETLNADGSGSFKDKANLMPEKFETVARTKDDLAAFLYTSGTTGRSKGAMLTQANLLSNAETLKDYWQFGTDDVLLHALPIFHTHGLFVATNVMLLCSGSIIFMPKFDLEQVISNLPKATSMMGVPTFYTRLLSDQRFDKDLTKHMRLFISGSAPLLAETHIQFEERTGHRILERYGMTETNMTTSNPYDAERRAGTVGFPLPGIEVRITDKETGNILPSGETGVLEVKGPNVFKGYWQMPDKTAEDFREDGFFITGDLAIIDNDDYVTIVGRDKDLIISGGYNIYPKEIELVLDKQPGVLESAVIGVAHPDFGESVIGLLVKNNQDQIDLSSIEAELGNNLARFKQPKKLVIVDELPRNTMGKVQKNLLREEYANSFTQ